METLGVKSTFTPAGREVEDRLDTRPSSRNFYCPHLISGPKTVRRVGAWSKIVHIRDSLIKKQLLVARNRDVEDRLEILIPYPYTL